MKIPEGYFAVLFKDKASGTIGVRFPDHAGIITYGKNWDEAQVMAQEALTAAFESDFYRGVSPPSAKKPVLKRGERMIWVLLPQDLRMAYQLRAWREEAGLTQKQLAEKLEVSYQAYQRMERPGRANLTVVTLQKIANALRKQLVLDLRTPRHAFG